VIQSVLCSPAMALSPAIAQKGKLDCRPGGGTRKGKGLAGRGRGGGGRIGRGCKPCFDVRVRGGCTRIVHRGSTAFRLYGCMAAWLSGVARPSGPGMGATSL
jgi:hypothetical protein